MKSHRTLCKLSTLAAALSLSFSALAADITGAGATFPYAVYTKWAEAYQTATKNRVNYQASVLPAASSRSRPGPWTSAAPTPR